MKTLHSLPANGPLYARLPWTGLTFDVVIVEYLTTADAAAAAAEQCTTVPIPELPGIRCKTDGRNTETRSLAYNDYAVFRVSSTDSLPHVPLSCRQPPRRRRDRWVAKKFGKIDMERMEMIPVLV